MYYWVRLRRNPFVFDLTIAKKLVAYTAKGVKWKFKCLVDMAYLPVAALLNDRPFPPIKSWAS